MYERIITKIPDDTKIYFILKGIIETSPNDYVAHLNPNDWAMLMLGERLENGSYYELDYEFSLNDSLCGKTVIEYPIFAVIAKKEIANWKIASPFTIGEKVNDEKNRENEKEDDKNDDIDDGPNYEEIKKSLIASFNQTFDDMNDNK